MVDLEQLQQIAQRYTAAWCSQDPASVASFFAREGSLTINDGHPSTGREAIALAAQAFMTAFPDLIVSMDGLSVAGSDVIYRWTLTGHHTGPGGTGNHVCISGHETWQFDQEFLIVESKGCFDAEEYRKQIESRSE